MAEVAGPLITALAGRIRDPQQMATTTNQWLTFLSQAQALWNAATRRVVTTTTLTLEASSAAYNISSTIPDCVRIISIREGARYLYPIAYASLQAADPAWLRSIGSSPIQWTVFGRDILIINPAVSTPTDLTITYVQHIAPMTSTADATTLPDYEHPGMLDIAEALAALRMRQFGTVQSAADRIKERLGGKS